MDELLSAPEEDHWQWFQSVPQLLGQEPPNQGPSQDWEFQLVDMQARGELDQPAYKNLSDDIVITAQNAVAQGGDQAVGGAASSGAPTPNPKPGARQPSAQTHVQRRRAQRKGVTGPQANPNASQGNRMTQQERKDARHGNNGPVVRPEGKTQTPEERKDARHGPNRQTLTGNREGMPISQQQAAQLESGIAQATAEMEAQSPGYQTHLARKASRGRNNLKRELAPNGGIQKIGRQLVPDGKALDALPDDKKMAYFEKVGRVVDHAIGKTDFSQATPGQAKAALLAVDLGLAVVSANDSDENFGQAMARELTSIGAGAATTGLALSVAAGIIGAPLTVTIGAAVVLGAMGFFAGKLAGDLHDQYMEKVAPSQAVEADR